MIIKITVIFSQISKEIFFAKGQKINAMIQKDVTVNFIISIGININNAKKVIITINIFNFSLNVSLSGATNLL